MAYMVLNDIWDWRLSWSKNVILAVDRPPTDDLGEFCVQTGGPGAPEHTKVLKSSPGRRQSQYRE